MKILYLSYWSANDPLSHATVVPNLNIIASFSQVEKIIFCSIERDKITEFAINTDKIVHVPLVSKEFSNIILTKINDFTFFSNRIISLCKSENIGLIICRSSLAGAIGYLVFNKIKIPYVVESFEPHADYMVQSNVWFRYSFRALIQKWFEFKQKKTARFLLPVTHNYFNKLVEEGLPSSRLMVVPCCIDVRHFRFDEETRKKVRESLNYNDQNITGIYVGKFGGIYYEKEAFDLFKKAFDFFGERFRLIVLSGSDHSWIQQQLTLRGINAMHFLVTSVAHHEVRNFLCAADFAFSTIKPAASRLYCSPIKNGEYWANGLPIIMEAKIGDDSRIINEEGGGVILDKDVTKSFRALNVILRKGRLNINEDIYPLATKHRGIKYIIDAYTKIFRQLDQH